MRKIYIGNDNLTRRIKQDEYISHQIRNKADSVTNIMRSNSVFVPTYIDLVKEIAELSYLNQDYLLFFRGQSKDFKAIKYSSLYPSIYRDERISKQELKYKFSILELSSNMLKSSLEHYSEQNEIIGLKELKKIKKLQWSILQHYEVCPTPLLDITHSLRVACSFALLDNNEEFAYIYVLAMPYLTGRISINSEHDLINIRLLSISPPQALRPFFQEGYLGGTEYVLDDYNEKNELDFNRRLIATYKIPNSNEFWNRGFNIISKELLYPKDDELLTICKDIKTKIQYNNEVDNESTGRFLFLWNKLEYWIRNYSGGQYNIISGLRSLKKSGKYEDYILKEIDEIRAFRNRLIHKPLEINLREIYDNEIKIEKLMNKLET